jgi:hypothetical protein
MLTARRKRPLSTGVPEADLMLFFDGFPGEHGPAVPGMPKTVPHG